MTEFLENVSQGNGVSHPYWLSDPDDQDIMNIRTSPELPKEVQDVVIIGGGMTGISAAYHCMECMLHKIDNDNYDVTRPFRCLLLEKSTLSAGATGRNGGFICPGTSEKYSDSCARYGSEETKMLFEYSVEGTEYVKQFLKKAGGEGTDYVNECEMRFNGCVSLALTLPELQDLQESYEFMLENGIKVEWWNSASCLQNTKSESYLGGLFKPYGGNLWAARVVFAAAKEAIKVESQINAKYGHKKIVHLNIQTNTAVTTTTNLSHDEGMDIAHEENSDNLVAVHTERGTVIARNVLHATNGWCRHLLPQVHDIVIPVLNQVIITKPAPPLWNFGLSANYGYEYFMQRPDGRIILGGMRDLSPTKCENSDNQESTNADISCALRAYLPKHFLGLAGVEVEKEWIGVLAFTPDRNPLVGSLSGRGFENQYIACGYAGHGMPLAFLMGKRVIDLMLNNTSTLGGDHTRSSIPSQFSPSRYGI